MDRPPRHGFSDPLTGRIVEFIRGLGLVVRRETLGRPTFLPGILIRKGELVVDEAALEHPGDLLHEAGHLAVSDPADRSQIDGKIRPSPGCEGGEEMAAIAWSFAAAVHLGIDPAVVFHAEGYGGAGESLRENFGHGRYVGVPMLQWLGMTADERNAAALGVPPYPHMTAWLRPASDGPSS